MKIKALFVLIASLGIAGHLQAATEIRVAYGNQPGEPVDEAVKQWAKNVKERSNGELILSPFPASQLGSETDVLEQARFGSAVISITAYSNFMSSVPDISVLDAPYLSEDFDGKLKVFESPWFSEQSEKVEEAGYHIVVPNVVYGVRQILSRNPVTTPDDLKGVKIRVQNSPMFVETVKAMGAVPTPMSLSDVYPALAQGMVDGVENPATVLFGGKFYEVVKQLSLTNHMHMVVAFATGKAFWDELSEEEQSILEETGQEMASQLHEMVSKESKSALEKLRDVGVEVNEVKFQSFQERAADQIPPAFPQWSDGLYDSVRKIISE